jgi:hypothetical protein
MKLGACNGSVTATRDLAAVMFAGLMMFAASRVAAADQAISPSAAANQHLVVSFGGKVKHPLQLNLDALQKLPAEHSAGTRAYGTYPCRRADPCRRSRGGGWICCPGERVFRGERLYGFP